MTVCTEIYMYFTGKNMTVCNEISSNYDFLFLFNITKGMLCVVSTAMELVGDKAENRDYPNPCAEPEPSNDCFEPRNTTKNNNEGHRLAIPIGNQLVRLSIMSKTIIIS